MRLVNLTPHSLFMLVGDRMVEIRPSGQVARVVTAAVHAYDVVVEDPAVPVVFLAPVFYTSFGEIENLPDPERGVVYVTSSLVAQAAAARGRTDVVAPDTSPESAIRNADGQIVAVRRLQTFASREG